MGLPLCTLLLISFSYGMLAIRFEQPQWKGNRLDRCVNFGDGCGEEAADLWCKEQGYAHSIAFGIDTEPSTPTRTLATDILCQPTLRDCDAFAWIDCEQDPIKPKIYSLPQHNGFRLDWCLYLNDQCGAPAADAFCRSKGYGNVVSFIREPTAVSTRTIGSNAVCFRDERDCESFSQIICAKSQ